MILRKVSWEESDSEPESDDEPDVEPESASEPDVEHEGDDQDHAQDLVHLVEEPLPHAQEESDARNASTFDRKL